MTSQMPAGLYIVATPIGHLGDMTFRAVEVLKSVDLIACEDTRVTRQLLSHFGIGTRTDSYNDHNGAAKRPALLKRLEAGESVALVSDAGTPLISDPGYKLVAEAASRGIPVYSVPGASSVMAALSVAGLPTDRFYFAGFVPPRTSARESWAHGLSAIPATLVCFETARRLPETLAVLAPLFPGREAAVARELTKRFEECARGTLAELAARYEAEPPRGEIVLLIGPATQAVVASPEDRDAAIREALRTLSVRDAAAEVAKALDLPRKEIYARAMELKREDRGE